MSERKEPIEIRRWAIYGKTSEGTDCNIFKDGRTFSSKFNAKRSMEQISVNVANTLYVKEVFCTKTDKNALKPCPSFPGYCADESGNIYRIHIVETVSKLKLSKNDDGYLATTCLINGEYKNTKAHQMVCDAFHGPRASNDYQVCHSDGSRDNNKPSNLRWGTAKENSADRTKHGRCAAARVSKMYRKKSMDEEQKS